MVSAYPKITIIQLEQDFEPNLQTSKNLNYLKTLRSESKEFLNKHLLMMEIYITYHLQILSFSSRFRRFEMKHFIRRPTMVADNI